MMLMKPLQILLPMFSSSCSANLQLQTVYQLVDAKKKGNLILKTKFRKFNYFYRFFILF